MIAAVIFAAHLIFGLIIFTYKWQNENLKSAFLNIILIGILFSVGWTITTIIAKLFLEQKGFGLYFDRDTFALSILTVSEYFFYKFYYKEEVTEDKNVQL